MTASGCRCQSAIFNASSTSSPAQMGRHRPANDAAAPGVHNDREIQEAGPHTDVSDVGYPEMIMPVRREISIDQVSSHRLHAYLDYVSAALFERLLQKAT